MSLYYLKAQRFNNKIKHFLLKKKIATKANSKIISNIFSTYCQILLINEKYKKSYKNLKSSTEFKKMLKEFQEFTNKSIRLGIKPPYHFIHSDDVYFLSSLFNNKNIISVFLKVFWYKNNIPNLENVLSSLLNDVIYLNVVSNKHKKIKNYKNISNEDIKIFTNILEVNKNFHKKIQILFPRQSNQVIVFVNSLLNI